jgi:hypothetical protein
MDSIDGKDKPIEAPAAGMFYLEDLVDVVCGMTLVSCPNRTREVRRDNVSVIVFELAKLR